MKYKSVPDRETCNLAEGNYTWRTSGNSNPSRDITFLLTM